MTGEDRDRLEHEAALKRLQEAGIALPKKYENVYVHRKKRDGSFIKWLNEHRYEFRPVPTQHRKHASDGNVDMWILDDFPDTVKGYDERRHRRKES